MSGEDRRKAIIYADEWDHYKQLVINMDSEFHDRDGILDRMLRSIDDLKSTVEAKTSRHERWMRFFTAVATAIITGAFAALLALLTR